MNILFDCSEGHSPRLVEIEDDNGTSRKVGEWIERDDGLWNLKITLDDFKKFESAT